MPAQLISLPEGFRILLDKPILLIGRDSECDIQLDSRKVSRRHCCIAQVSDYLVIRDLDSTNGIRINGVRVRQGNLKAGDELTIGNHRYQIRWDNLAVERPSAGLNKEMNHQEQARHFRTGRAMDDAALESCDEPVPLADPNGQSHDSVRHKIAKPPDVAPVPDPPPAPPANPLSLAPEEPPSLSLMLSRPVSLIVPEKLELAPASEQEIFPGFPKRKPAK